MPLLEATRADERHLQDIADTIASSHKILIVTGAGISTSIGIPDFRSKDGLYNLIPEQTLPSPPPSQPSTPSKERFASPTGTPSRKRKASESVDEDQGDLPPSTQSSTSSRRSSVTPTKRLRGQDLFDSRVFNSADSTTIFYRFIASLREKIHDDVKETSATHKFIRVLRDGGRLMRCYTQNIDGLEAREGLVMDLKRGKGTRRRFQKKYWAEPRPDHPAGSHHDGGCEVVQLHGDLDTLRCSVCATQWTWTENETEVFTDGFAPRCKKCARKSDERQKTGKRGLAVGSLRPNIVLYGEDHPQNSLLSPFVPYDAGSQPDVLIIMGTSLKVFGLQKIIREFAKAVHAQKKGKVIFVNRTKPAESVWDNFIDYFIPMDCDDWIDDLKLRRSDLWFRQGELDLKVSKKTSVKRKRKSEDGEDITLKRPTKKPKFWVEIPSQQPDDGVGNATMLQPAVLPLTPRHNHANSQSLRRNLLSPLTNAKRPDISPMTDCSHPRTPTRADAFARMASPKAPAYSPLTPATFAPSSLQHAMSAESDFGVEIQESDHEKENMPNQKQPGPSVEEDTIVVTPCKRRFSKNAELPAPLDKVEEAEMRATRSTRELFPLDRLKAAVVSALRSRRARA
ncbi:uncharacterized protein HMPREF1541_08952 [Cyphellophora europaea CBS 101466]|uniref:Deacetylase sirtuin-type domain-containing protein n=1 Tax=Cyphellophora europaea (strain CBS 101466) TaxID=1220924 RepID=W2RLR3_CYPE1|nr:uncharacterized protein HMPREF1541_08952 [Cyphellophora europaea CBS 101466]ETN36674.1 hypothetical protein HMPREF1541_08952 [Cyphellophora europaea CBS 101466]